MLENTKGRANTKIVTLANKYEEEERLLKKYENECRYGHLINPTRDLEIGIRSEKAQDLIKNLQKSNHHTLSSSSTIDSTQQPSDSSDFILNHVLGQLCQTKKIKDGVLPSTSTIKSSDMTSNLSKQTPTSSSSLQFNNYTTQVDELNKFGLKSEWTSYNRVEADETQTGSSSSNSSASSSSGIWDYFLIEREGNIYEL